MSAAPRLHERPDPGPAAARLPRIASPRTILRPPRPGEAGASIEIVVPDAGGRFGGPHDRDGAFAAFAATSGLRLGRGHGLQTVTDRAGTTLGLVRAGCEPGKAKPAPGGPFRAGPRNRGRATAAAAAFAAAAGAGIRVHRHRRPEFRP